MLPEVSLLVPLGFLSLAAAGYPPIPEGTTVVQSKTFPGVSISYKETRICETTPGVKSYSGYVNLPPDASEGRDYEVHTFFWFFEARHDPHHAPLAMWLQGGPGTPTVTAALGENGPCYILDDSKSTELNKWSWNDRVNMLYIDQPVGTGFSYGSLVHGTINELVTPYTVTVGNQTATNATTLAGTFPSQDLLSSPNTTLSAAPAVWHFLQTWAQEFPQYRPAGDKFSIWTESYGGHYGPTYADYFETQSDRIASGALLTENIPFRLDAVGLVNSCVDLDTQMPFYPIMAHNNTYGIQRINETQYESAMAAWPQCKNLTAICRSMGDELDPQAWGNNTAVNKACFAAYNYCFENVHPYPLDEYIFDIASPAIENITPKWAAGYLNTPEIQQALGVPLNFTGQSLPVATVFTMAGDFVRGHNLEILGSLLDRGVKIAMVYGDRDYQCNWLGGEAVSLAIQSTISSDFSKAGYANIETNGSYVGGLVRQHGNLSFSRVFEAGHQVPYYQPETAYEIFNRVMFNRDVATGNSSTLDRSYSSSGPSNIFSVKNQVPSLLEARCFFWDMLETCTLEQIAHVANGSAIIEDFLIVGYRSANGSVVLYNGTMGTSGSTAGSAGTSVGVRHNVLHASVVGGILGYVNRG